MIIRSAILEGDVAPADRAQFDRHMAETVVAAIGTYPRIKGVQLRRTVECDEGALPIYMQFDLLFDIVDFDALHDLVARHGVTRIVHTAALRRRSRRISPIGSLASAQAASTPRRRSRRASRPALCRPLWSGRRGAALRKGGFAGFPYARPAPSDLTAARAELGYTPHDDPGQTIRDYAASA